MHTRDIHLGRTAVTALQAPDADLPRRRGIAAETAFSLVELLTAVSIMMVIIFTLYSMFNQTQKALRANITQVDVMESGRAAAEVLGRELEQMSACNLAQTINLYAGLTPIAPLMQTDLDEKRPLRTNVLQEFFFLTRQTNKWVGTGYRVMRADSGVGTLYRYSASTNYYTLTYTNLIDQFVRARLFTNTVSGALSTNFHRLADGIIHLRLTAYDPNGQRMDFNSTNTFFPSYRVLRVDSGNRRLGLVSTANDARDANVILRQERAVPDTQFSFTSNALPGYVELELGVLEAGALKQYESLRDAPRTASTYLRKQAGKVHLFRQRIPIRTVLQQ